MIDPGALMAKIEESAAEIDTCGKELAEAIRKSAETEAHYERAKETALLEIHAVSKEKGDRVAADLRMAMAHKKMDSHVFALYLLNKAAAEALRARLRALEASTSARQSLLATMREEVRVTA